MLIPSEEASKFNSLNLGLIQNEIYFQALCDNPSFELITLYVGDIDKSLTESDLRRAFEKFTRVLGIRICRDEKTNESLGYAYVNCYTKAEAENAMKNLNCRTIEGKPCRVSWVERDPTKRKTGEANLLVKNLCNKVDSESLLHTFQYYGDLISVKVCLDELGVSKGFGFVRFASEKAAEDALKQINISNVMFGGKRVHVEKFIRKEERPDAKTIDPKEYKNLFVKNFPKTWKDADLREKFEKFGEITSCVIQKDENGDSLGYGFCSFAEHQMALAAVTELDNFEIEEGKKMTVCRAMTKYQRQAFLRIQAEKYKQEMHDKFRFMNLYVKNFSDDVTDEKLKELFNEFGEITSCKVMTDEKNRSRGFGFVCFKNPEDAEKAINEMNNKMMNDRPLYVGYAQSKNERIKLMNQSRDRASQASAMMMNPPPMYFGMVRPIFHNQNRFQRNFTPRPRNQNRHYSPHHSGPQNSYYRNKNNYRQQNYNNTFEIPIRFKEIPNKHKGNSSYNSNTNTPKQEITYTLIENQNILPEKPVREEVKMKMKAGIVFPKIDTAQDTLNEKIVISCQKIKTEKNYEESVENKVIETLLSKYKEIEDARYRITDDQIRKDAEEAYKSFLEPVNNESQNLPESTDGKEKTPPETAETDSKPLSESTDNEEKTHSETDRKNESKAISESIDDDKEKPPRETTENASEVLPDPVIDESQISLETNDSIENPAKEATDDSGKPIHKSTDDETKIFTEENDLPKELPRITSEPALE